MEESLGTNQKVEQAETIDELARMTALVRELSDRPREVVELRLVGLTDREIAEVLGITGQAVRQAQSRAVAQLRIRMGVTPHAKRNSHD
jgi:RNA polymerase sigma factor (sigma-70 family)